MKTLLFSVCLFLVGCVSTGTMRDTAAAQTVQIDVKTVTVSGEIVSPYKHNEFSGSFKVSRHLVIAFDSVPVIDGNLSSDATGELTGNYAGHAITSICSSQHQGYNLRVDCMILIDGKRTVTLTF